MHSSTHTPNSGKQRRAHRAKLHSANQQTTQIVENLRQRKHRIDQQESEFRLRILNWESAAASQQSALDQRQQELDLKEQRLRDLQFQMLELQNQLIESQLALESIVDQVTQPVTVDEPMSGLEQLRHELFERFDFVEQRWRQMRDELQQVADRITQSVNQPTPPTRIEL